MDLDQLDLNIKNYTFDDILNLFRLNEDYTEKDIIQSKNMVLAIHPDNSKLDKCYYTLFSEAYDKIHENYAIKMSNKDVDANSSFIKALNKQINKEDYVDIINESEKNSSLKSLLNNNPYPYPTTACYNNSTLSTQIMTIHTEDRDIKKWPTENNFEVELPLVIKNVLSVELCDITFPTKYLNISDNLQNNSLWFTVLNGEPMELKLDTGFYNETDLCDSLATKLNESATIYLNLQSVSYTKFKAIFNKITQKITITNTTDQFEFWCHEKSNYYNTSTDNWNMNIDWGLPYNLGFNKSLYQSVSLNNKQTRECPNIISILFSKTIYMEIDKFNYMNEIVPFSKSTTTSYDNDYYGKTNSAFAKLMISNNSTDSNNSNNSNTFIPIKKFKRILPHMEEKIARLKFRFRYHNGQLVDFNNQQFNFSLRFECRFDCKY